MAAYMQPLQHPVNAVRGVLGFTASLIVVPTVLWPARRRGAKDVQGMEGEAKELAKVCSEMYKSPTERASRASELFGWELLDRFNHDKWAIYKRGTDLLLAFQGTHKWADLFADLKILFNGESMMNLDPYVKGLQTAQEEHPGTSRIMVTGHSLGGTLAWAVAKRLQGHAEVCGHVFNPGSTWDMDKYFTEERLLAGGFDRFWVTPN